MGNTIKSKLTVVFGACSAIASEWSELRAAKGDSFILVDRDSKKLEITASHLRVKYNAQVATQVADLTDFSAVKKVIGTFIDPIGRALIAHGFLGDQVVAQSDLALAQKIIDVNYTSYVAILTLVTPLFKAQGFGKIVCISSVAGDRGRSSNYVYGSAKAGLSAYLSGLRAALAGSGVEVITIKPGMVDTPMTAHMKKGPLFSKPNLVAELIEKAAERGASSAYVPGWWKLVMLIIIHIPEAIFKKMKF